MATDLAIDYGSGDLMFAGNKDLQVRTGQSTVDQRIRVRLRIVQGEWLLDPTDGTLGSRLLDAMRLPVERAQAEVPLIVKEALEPMDDIIVGSVECVPNEENANGLDLTINYSIIDDLGNEDEEVETVNLTVVG